ATPPATTALSPLSLHDALPICLGGTSELAARETGASDVKSSRDSRRQEPKVGVKHMQRQSRPWEADGDRSDGIEKRGTGVGGRGSEEHTSELQSPYDLVCRLLL